MTVTAANTWGIASSAFLAIYVGLCLLWVAGVWFARARLSGPAAELGGREPDVYELAVLAGGVSRAVTAAAARLRADGVLEPGQERRTLRAVRRPKGSAAPLERAVFDAVSNRPGINIRNLRREISRSSAAVALSARLLDSGLLLSLRAQWRVRMLWIAVLPLFGLGVARLIAGVHNHKPIAYLTVIVCAVAAWMVWLGLQRPQATRAGMRVLARLRTNAQGWRAAPQNIAPPLAVALFGSGALWLIDPAFAAAWSVPREKAAVWMSNYGGAGCGGGGGGGCGGGGGGCGG